MTLPVSPEVDTILASCIETLREVVMREVSSEWGRYSGELAVASLEYGRRLLRERPDEERRAVLADAVAGLRGAVAASGSAALRDALTEPSPFVAASRLLVQAQNEPGPLAEAIRSALHPVLDAQLDAELQRSSPLFGAFARNMAGAR